MTLPAAPGVQRQRTAWLLFAPLAAVVGLRWVLTWLADRAAAPPAWPLAPFEGVQDPLGWLRPLGWGTVGLLVLLALGWLVRRRFGARPVRRALAAAWVLLCLAACAALLGRHLNLRALQPQPPVAAEVLGSRFQPPTARGPGGTLLVLRLGAAGPQQVLIDDPAAARLHAGQQLRLHWAQGRLGGRFVTGWETAEAAGPLLR